MATTLNHIDYLTMDDETFAALVLREDTVIIWGREDKRPYVSPLVVKDITPEHYDGLNGGTGSIRYAVNEWTKDGYDVRIERTLGYNRNPIAYVSLGLGEIGFNPVGHYVKGVAMTATK